MSAETAALENRVSRLESEVSNGFSRVESLLRDQISDLKKEQIKDLKDLIIWLADDQRRLWKQIGELQKRELVRYGGERKLGSLWHFVTGIVGGLSGALATYFSTRPHP